MRYMLLVLLVLCSAGTAAAELNVTWEHPTKYVPECANPDPLPYPTAPCLSYKPQKELPLSEILKTEITCVNYIEGGTTNFPVEKPCQFASLDVPAPASAVDIPVAVPPAGGLFVIAARTYAVTTPTPSDYSNTAQREFVAEVVILKPLTLTIMVRP